MRAAGMPDGNYMLGSLEQGQEVVVEDGVAKLLDRSAFAGSVATMDRVVRTVQQLTERPMPEIVRSATETPARIMGIADKKGAVEVGYDADIVVFDDEVNVMSTIVNGQIVYNI
jgi:N-acetylglucosamine-6-phosphate deacetylase